MRILLVYPGIIFGEQPLGLLYISAALKKSGHQTRLFELTSFNTLGARIKRQLGLKIDKKIQKAFLQLVSDYHPGLIGFYISITDYALSSMLSKRVKENFDIPVIWGGPNPTIDPDETIANKFVDIICVGEGEYAMLELVTKLENHQDISRINNIWVKDGNKIYKNPVRPLIQNLDELPFPDRDIIDRNILLSSSCGTSFLTSRGCPYKCSYCINEYLQDLYRGKGRFVRQRDMDCVISEIKEVVEKYGIKNITFSDETFTLNKNRTIKFCELYKKEIKLPFQCQTRANEIDEEILVALKEAGCESLNMGIESGSEELRTILQRKMSAETILKAFSLAKKVGLKTASFNMIGIPTESEQTVWETININRKTNPDFVMCTILMPFKGIKLRELYDKENWIKKEISEGYYTSVIQELPTIDSKKLIAYQQLFDLYVKLPRKYFGLINFLKKIWLSMPDNKYISRIYRFFVYGITKFIKIMLRKAGNL